MRGIQAGRNYYVSICKLSLISKVFVFDNEDLPANLRSQRKLNAARIPDIARYITSNLDSYVFSAITASIDGDVSFIQSAADSDIGHLHIPMSSTFVINDGQHRKAAIELALVENPSLAEETIAVVFFIDPELKRSQQMFADLNRYSVKPSKSLGILYDSRDKMGHVVRQLVKSKAFNGLVDLEKTNLSKRSGKLFTLSSIYTATKDLLANIDFSCPQEESDLAILFWKIVAQQFPEWNMVRKHKISAGEIREESLHTHSIMLHAIGIAGNQLLKERPPDWKKRLEIFSKIDWSRSNSDLWEGKAMTRGRIIKSRNNLLLTSCFIKKELGLQLSEKEQNLVFSVVAKGKNV